MFLYCSDLAWNRRTLLARQDQAGRYRPHPNGNARRKIATAHISPSGIVLTGPFAISVLPFTAKVGQGTVSPFHNLTFEAEVTFCVQGVVSPLLSNILLTPFDWEMRRRGYRLTRYADDWLITCRSRGEARAALEEARRILAKLGVTLNTGKTRIVHVRHGFEFLGYKIKQGKRPLRCKPRRSRAGFAGERAMRFRV